MKVQCKTKECEGLDCKHKNEHEEMNSCRRMGAIISNKCECEPTSDIEIKRKYFESLDKDALIYMALALSADCSRLRRELDSLKEIIR